MRREYKDPLMAHSKGGSSCWWYAGGRVGAKLNLQGYGSGLAWCVHRSLIIYLQEYIKILKVGN